jgi:hypothetical protein
MHKSISIYTTLLFLLHVAYGHTVIVYPGWRGDNLHANGTVDQTQGLMPGGPDNNLWPYGMQWNYPCGGMPTSTNRTKWSTLGGAVAFQPGWFQGHSSAQIFINMGFGTNPPNMSNPMMNGVEIVGPTNEPYPGTWCFPHVPLPANRTVNVGDNATIQVIELAKHGAALYNCADITFAEPGDPEIPLVTQDNCFNSTYLSYNLVFTTESLSMAAPSVERMGTIFAVSVAALTAYILS